MRIAQLRESSFPFISHAGHGILLIPNGRGIYISYRTKDRNQLHESNDILFFSLGIVGMEEGMTHRLNIPKSIRRVLDTMTDVIYISTFKGGELVYLSPSAADLFGYNYATLVETPNLMYEAVHPDDRDHFNTAMRRHLSSGLASMEYRIVRPDGIVRWIHADCHLFDSENDQTQSQCIFRDLTHIRRKEDRIARLNELKGELHRERTLDEKLQRIADSLIELFEVDRIYIWVRTLPVSQPGSMGNPDESELELRAGSLRSADGNIVRSLDVPFGISRIHRLAQVNSTRVFTNDMTRDPFADDIEWAEENGVKAFAGYRIVSMSGDMLGVMAIYSTASISETDDVHLQGVANMTGHLIQSSHAETALKISEQNYREIFNNVMDVMAVIDGRELKIRDVNERALDEYGLSAEDAGDKIREMVRDALPPFSVDNAKDFYRLALKEGTAVFDWPMRSREGKERWFEVHLRRAVIGGEISLVASARDITERRAIEKELEEYRSRLELLVDERTTELSNTVERLQKEIEQRLVAEREILEREELHRAITTEANDGIVIMNTAGRVVFWNPAAERIFGYRAEEVEGKRLLPLIASEKDYDLYRNGIDRFMSIGSDAIDPGHFESTARRRDGSTFPMEFSLSAVEIWGGWHAVGLIRDTSARKRAERALRESEMRFRELQDNLPIGVFRTNPDGRLLSVNRAVVKLFRYDSVEEMLHTPVSKLYADPHERRALLDALARDGRIINAELHTKRKDGSTFNASLNVTTVYTRDGEIKYHDGTVEDISARKRMLELIKTNESRLRDIIYIIAGWIWELDAEFAHTFVSAPTDTILGYQYSEILGKTPFDFMLEIELKRFRDQIQEFREGNRPLRNVRMNLMTKTGDTVEVLVDGIALFDDRKNFLGYRGITRYL